MIKHQAWESEDAALVIYGTHDPEKARTLLREFLTGCGFQIGDDEWPDDEEDSDFYSSSRWQLLWTDAASEDDDKFTTFTEPAPKRTPFMIYFQ